MGVVLQDMCAFITSKSLLRKHQLECDMNFLNNKSTIKRAKNVTGSNNLHRKDS